MNARQARARAHAAHPASSLRGFSLVELLIVIGIIVLVIALAVPAFNLINGTRSVDAAENLVSVLLGRARTEAIGVQQIRGVMFYIDPVTRRYNIALVQATDPPNLNPRDVDVYLELGSGGDIVSLPQGVGVQVVDDVVMSGGIRQNDGYIGYNTMNFLNPGTPLPVACGGVILFDGRGQLVSRSYAFRARTNNTIAPPFFSNLGLLLHQPSETELSAPAGDHVDIVPVDPSNPLLAIRSAVGLVLFDAELFQGIDDHSLGDPQIDAAALCMDGQGVGPYAGKELAEEIWLDQNARPLLVNRYNGTLVKGE